MIKNNHPIPKKYIYKLNRDEIDIFLGERQKRRHQQLSRQAVKLESANAKKLSKSLTFSIIERKFDYEKY
jgi:hypothetical protein